MDIWTAFAPFPSGEGARIDPDLGGKLALSDALSFPMVDQLLGQSVSIWERIEPQESHQSGHVIDRRLSIAFLPTDQRHLGTADQFCHLDLTES